MKSEDVVRSESLAMEILIYFSTGDGTGAKLQRIMDKFTAEAQVKFFRNWGVFVKNLMRPGADTAIAVILLSQREELLDAVSIRDLIHEYKLILILPDREEETISLGHTLRPNFMTYKMGDLRELEIVLQKMLYRD